MRHFVVEITYTAPLERIEAVLAEHRAYLQEGYDRGMLLCSGPQEPRVGGMVLARAAERAEIENFFAADPYRRAGLADYRIIEFAPVKRQPFLEDWAGGR